MFSNDKILRILQHAFRDSKFVDLYNNFNTLTLPNLHKLNVLLFVRKFFSSSSLITHKLDHFFHNISLTKNTDLHNHSLILARSKNELHIIISNHYRAKIQRESIMVLFA